MIWHGSRLPKFTMPRIAWVVQRATKHNELLAIASERNVLLSTATRYAKIFSRWMLQNQSHFQTDLPSLDGKLDLLLETVPEVLLRRYLSLRYLVRQFNRRRTRH
jgi:hypothetical protein